MDICDWPCALKLLKPELFFSQQLAKLHSRLFLASYLCVISTTTRQIVLICFCIFKSNKYSIFLQKFFLLVCVECDAYLSVDQSLVYSHSNLIYSNQSSLELSWIKTIFLDSYLGFFLSFVRGSSQLQNLNSVIDIPYLVNLVFPYLCQYITNQVANFGSLSSRLYVLVCFLSLALHTEYKNIQQQKCDVFIIAAHVFRDLFLKIFPLFDQILITCVKCSRASFSPSSYSEKMRWGRGCLKMKKLLTLTGNVKTNFKLGITHILNLPTVSVKLT